MSGDSAFGDLRRLADWFATLSVMARRSPLLFERLVQKLGVVCVPLLGRELCSRDPQRREVAREALAMLASGDARERVLVALRSIASGDAADEGKVCALGLLAELGERGEAKFCDPGAIQKRSALALASQLDTAGDVAAAADMMIRTLDDDAMLQLLEVMAAAAASAAHRLGDELCSRLDLSAQLRERIANVALSPAELERTPDRRAPRPTLACVLVDAAARLVVIATRRCDRKWRRWAVLIDAHGRIEDCIHEDQATTDAAPLVAQLVADGYRVASNELEHARAIVTAAARVTADCSGEHALLESPYYLGRDLLDLGDAHLGGRSHAPTSTRVGRAIELIADGEPARALALLAGLGRRDAGNPEVFAAHAACLLAQDRPADAVEQLLRAVEAEPSWPLHHWNLAAAYHQLGDARACYHALRRFVATSSQPTGLFADPDQPGRVALAERMLLELERTARLTGNSLARRRSKKRASKRRVK